MSSVKTIPLAGAPPSTRFTMKIAFSTTPAKEPFVAVTKSTASRARSKLLTLNSDISQLPSLRNRAMAGWSAGYRASRVRRQLTPGPISSLRRTDGSPPFISFSTNCPDLEFAVPRTCKGPPRRLRERGSDAFIDEFLDVFCRACLSCRRSVYTSQRAPRGSRLGQAHHLGLRFIRRSTRHIRARAFPRPGVCPEYGPVVDAGAALALGVVYRMRAARRRHPSYAEEVRALVVHPARIDVLSICLHDLPARCSHASHRSIRVDLRAKGSLFCRRRMGSRRAAVPRLVARPIQMDDFIWAHRPGDCRDLFCRRTFSSSGVCARRAFGKDDALLGPIPQPMGIPR